MTQTINKQYCKYCHHLCKNNNHHSRQYCSIQCYLKNLSGSNNPMFHKHHSHRTRQLQSLHSKLWWEKHPNAHNSNKNPFWRHKHTKIVMQKVAIGRRKWLQKESSKEKLRNSKLTFLKQKFKHIKDIRDIAKYGRYEKEFLDMLEEALHYKIIRQYPIIGYFIDGYIPERKIAIEIDEAKHFKYRYIIKDRIRQHRIEKALGCQFIRIKSI